MGYRFQPRRPPASTIEAVAGAAPDNRAAKRRSRKRRPSTDPHSRDFVYWELRARLSIDSGKLEGLAESTHVEAVVLFPFGDALPLAAGKGFAVEDHDACGCGVSGLHPRILHVKRSCDAQKYNLRVLHELAHALLREHYPEHTHADVWALTLMLAIPRPWCKHAELARHVARWVADLRRMVARRVSREAA